jgi:small-conductance mechanosensitive channel
MQKAINKLEGFMSELLKNEELIWIIPPVVVVLVWLLLASAKKILWNRLEKWAARTDSTVDDLLLAALKTPTTFLIFVVAAWAGTQTAPATFKDLNSITLGFKIAFIIAAVWIADRILRVLILAVRLPEGMNEGLRSIVKTAVRVALFAVGFMVALDTLGVSITPLLASLGIGSLAVALALQDTLGNFFSGMYLQFEQPVRIGDYVKLENGNEGYICNIGWRSTHVRLTSENTIIIPNNKLSSSIILNYNMPHPETIMLVEAGVAYGSDLEKVENVVVEVGREIMKKESIGGVPSYQPLVRYHTFADSSINFTVVLRARHWTDQGYVKHEFIKSLHSRFNKEGIEIPFPQRVVHYVKGEANY